MINEIKQYSLGLWIGCIVQTLGDCAKTRTARNGRYRTRLRWGLFSSLFSHSHWNRASWARKSSFTYDDPCSSASGTRIFRTDQSAYEWHLTMVA